MFSSRAMILASFVEDTFINATSKLELCESEVSPDKKNLVDINNVN